MQQVGVKGIHIAERDTQRAKNPKPRRRLRQHLVGRGLRLRGPAAGRARLGHASSPGCRRTAARTTTAAAPRSTCCSRAPTRACAPGRRPRGPQYGFLVTHNESISIADYFTRAGRAGKAVYRPTCHYAYHPCDDAVLSLHEMFGAGRRAPARAGTSSTRTRSSTASTNSACCSTATAGTPTGTARSSRSRRRARIAPYQNATGPAGHLGRARRHGLGAGEPEGRHRRGRRDGFPPLPRGADALSRPGDRRIHRLDAARRPARACSRRTSTRPSPGRSATCSCG